MNNVRLVGVTKPRIEELDNAEELLAYIARVSNPSNQLNTETAPRLIKYLAKHKHWSPFEMVHVVMEINTTRDIAHQIIRHRSYAFQEFSQRYSDPRDLGFEIREARLQDSKNRQNSIEVQDSLLQEHWAEKQQQVIDLAREVYAWAINAGIAKEQARAVLPEGLTKTRLYMSGSLRSWIHFIQTRHGMDTQKEHRLIALECENIILQEFPTLRSLFDE